MPYIPNSNEDVKKMLDRIGTSGIDDLFSPIPENLRLTDLLDLPPALPEPELTAHLEALAGKNNRGEVSFVGGGIYNHFVPPVVWTLVMRPEFATAYTPYQAEVAQGTLQVIYEYQSHICRLTGMDVANASMYDGASAMAEAAILALNQTGRDRVIVSGTVHPHFIEVLKTTLSGKAIEIIVAPVSGLTTDFAALRKIIDNKAACYIAAQPNFFGYLEEIEQGKKAIHEAGGLFVTVNDPISLGVLKTPAEYGADIAVGEGQGLGIPQNYGGPLLGFFACNQKFIRKLPGRLVARTTDVDGRDGFVLTLQTREQHIRRDKATSNICTNEALCATAATIYMSLMGRQGIPRVARLSMERAHYLAEKLDGVPGVTVDRNAPFFKEFVVKTPLPAKDVVREMRTKGIAPGIDLGRFYPDMKDHLLVAVTEMVSFADCDRYVKHFGQLV